MSSGQKPNTNPNRGIATRNKTLSEIDQQLEESKGNNTNSEVPNTSNSSPAVSIEVSEASSSNSSKLVHKNKQERKQDSSGSSSDGECSSSSSSDSSSSDSSDSESEETTAEKGLVSKKFRSISINDRSILKSIPVLMSRFASLPSDVSAKGGTIFTRFGSDLKDAKANIKEICRNLAKIQNKEKRKQEKSELKLIKNFLSSIIEELIESRTGMFGPNLIALTKETTFKRVLGSKEQQKILQQLKLQLASHKTICQSPLKSISNWKKPFQDPRRYPSNSNFGRSQPKRTNPWKDSWKIKKEKRE